jgi:two-component system, OmpR family, sensor kinase
VNRAHEDVVRTLFLRIFLSFWVAMVLVLFATASVAWYRLRQVPNIDVNTLVEQASQRFQAGGLDGLTKWVGDIERANVGLTVFVVNAAGDDVLGRRLPDRWRGYLARLERAGLLSPRLVADPEPDPLLLTPQFTDKNGAVYTVMRELPASPYAVLSTPDVRALLLLFALFISGFVCWLLARYVSKPVERLQSSARSLAAGNLEARVGEEFSRRRDELGVLARDFDTMADHVRNLIASKESLLRAMSHELRSPLARMRVALGLARRKGEDVGRQLDRIELEAERLDTLIGQMLQLSQLRAIEPNLPREPVDLISLLSEVVEDARLEANATNKDVAWTPGAALVIEGDHGLLRSAIENVLRNAVRFTAPGTAVRVTLEQQRDHLLIVIEDHGPGVPEAELERIFEPFYRVAEARDRDTGGTGLGLAITQRVVDLYDGTVRARNIHGGGLRVEIRLPRKESASSGHSPAVIRAPLLPADAR